MTLVLLHDQYGGGGVTRDLFRNFAEVHVSYGVGG